MRVTRREGDLYWIQPTLEDPSVYEGFLLRVLSTGSLFLVGPRSRCYGPPRIEWELELLGIEGTELELEVGSSVDIEVVERPQPTCCEVGSYLTWHWPFPAKKNNSGASIPGWYEGSGPTCYSFWRLVGPNCPYCGAPLPDPGIGERVLGRKYLLGLLLRRCVYGS
jgi:hypothetical protein